MIRGTIGGCHQVREADDSDILGHRCRVARGGQPRRIERLSHQRRPSHEQQNTRRRVFGIRIDRDTERRAGRRLQRAGHEAAGSVSVDTGVEEVPPVRQKVRPRVRDVMGGGIEDSGGSRNAAGDGNLLNRRLGVCPEHNHAVRAP